MSTCSLTNNPVKANETVNGENLSTSHRDNIITAVGVIISVINTYSRNASMGTTHRHSLIAFGHVWPVVHRRRNGNARPTDLCRGWPSKVGEILQRDVFAVDKNYNNSRFADETVSPTENDGITVNDGDTDEKNRYEINQ